MLQPVFDSYAEHYRRAFCAAMLWRLGVRSRGEESDQQLVEAMAEALSKTGIGIDRFFFDWFGGHRHGPGPEDAGYARPDFTAFLPPLSRYEPPPGSTPDFFPAATPRFLPTD